MPRPSPVTFSDFPFYTLYSYVHQTPLFGDFILHGQAPFVFCSFSLCIPKSVERPSKSALLIPELRS